MPPSSIETTFSSSSWPAPAASFVKVMPRDYKRALHAAADAVAAATDPEQSYAQVAHG